MMISHVGYSHKEEGLLINLIIDVKWKHICEKYLSQGFLHSMSTCMRYVHPIQSVSSGCLFYQHGSLLEI